MARAEDVEVGGVWQSLKEEARSTLIDVRTKAEWAFVGLTDLSALGKKPILVEWQSFPSMGVNEAFIDELKSKLSDGGEDKARPLYFLCRSGGRSKAAGLAASEMGFSRTYNITHGFEGVLDEDGHRGRVNGWQAKGLPWVQS